MQKMIDKYNELTKSKNSTNYSKIKTHIPTPVELDYKKGYILRYFCQKTNDTNSPIYELDSIQYSKYKNNPFYIVANLRWRISGPKETVYDDKGNILDKSVSESNRISIKLVSNKIPNLKLYLPNLLQFYK